MQIVKDLKKPPAKGVVRVQMLKYVGSFQPNDVVDCTADEAEHLCVATNVQTGGGAMVVHQKAVKLSDIEKSANSPKSFAGLSQHEASLLGQKNVVKTPADPQFEKRLESIRKMDKDYADGKETPPLDEKASGKPLGTDSVVGPGPKQEGDDKK